MQIKIFCVPIASGDVAEEELNRFLRSSKIIDIRKELAVLNGNSCWTFCITYIESSHPLGLEGIKGGSKVDYKEVLDEESFGRFSAFRKIRKQLADQDAIPAFAVFTDAELAEMAKYPVLTLTEMQKVPGIGKKKVEKYGMAFVENGQVMTDEKSRGFEGTDSESR